MRVNSSKPVSVSEVNELLSKRQKKEELAYEQQQSLDHAEKFAKLPPKDAEKLAAKIAENEKIALETAVKVVDILPKKIETLRAIMVKDKVTLSDEELNEIFKLLHAK
ncbi:MAG TPA: RNA polymerase Rpb4 family protein [Candidatus Bilamarchaeaceae archaeon]|nr:RNA polymerase Rpb4 family protein [Candidatus Bilamarchaeaceae archaeon]